MASHKNFQNKRRKYQRNMFEQRKASSNAKNAKLSKEGMIERIVEWTTFYRRNMHRFVEHYLGINLFWFQKIMIYLMAIYPEVVIIASRGIGKSWIVAVYACAKCILYPGSKVVIASKTLKQANLIVFAKIQNELVKKSQNLEREIESITKEKGNGVVKFHNGSSITVVPASDSSRGYRATDLIYEEYRQIDKEIKDSVLSPFGEVRQPPYAVNDPKDCYKEEPREIYISSAWLWAHWMGDELKLQVKNWLSKNNDNTVVFAFDVALVLKHGLKTIKQVLKDKRKFSPLAFATEYLNIMQGIAEGGHFSYDQMNPSRTLMKAFYPASSFKLKIKNNFFKYLPRTDGEIRIVSVDVSMMSSENKDNDNTAITCIRAVPQGAYYKRMVPYIETHEGGLTQTQALRIKQIMHDFDGDILVLDGRNAGVEYCPPLK